MMAKMNEIKKWSKTVSERIEQWRSRLGDLRRRNAAMEKEDERVLESEFAIDLALQVGGV